MGLSISADLLHALRGGSVVLTPNQRSARTVRRAFDRAEGASVLRTWTPPAVFAMETWLSNQWHRLLVDGTESRFLLSTLQEHTLWREIAARDPEVSALRSLDALADLAAGAWRLLCLYNGRGRVDELDASTDSRAFARWAGEFQRLCARDGYLSAALLPAALAQAAGSGTLGPLPSILLVDFEAHAPAYSRLFEALRRPAAGRAGIEVESLQTSALRHSAELHSVPDDYAELCAAASWAARQLERDPSATVAVVVPNLAERRGALDRVFAEIVGAGRFEFSLGRSLAESCLVATALDLLRWTLGPLPLETISALLLSPFCGASTPELALQSAEFDVHELRRLPLLRPELALDAAIHAMAHSRRAQRLGPLLRSLRTMRRAAESEHLDERKSHGAWATAFRNLLNAAGVRDIRANDSLTFQTERAWSSALDALATLDFDGLDVAAAAALGTLRRIAVETVFAPESGDAPVQIMGPLEPGGVTFDALWFMGADDRGWPPAPALNPMLPWELRRDLGVPGSDAARDRATAQALTGRLAAAATRVVFSFAERTEDALRRPSALLSELALSAFAGAAAEMPPTPSPLEEVLDTEPLSPLPDTTFRGGARILELQAACSFRAFAEFRLGSSAPETRTAGFDARERGVQVHGILQEFWAGIETQERLNTLTTPERNARLDACIDRFLSRKEAGGSAEQEPKWEIAYLGVQRERLRALLLPWLDFEAKRPEFSVLQREVKQLAAIGPLRLELRADRIDQTASGLLILDYKTGAAHPSEWQGDRPDAPQLPLYAALAGSLSASASGPLAGVAFALLRAGEGLDLCGLAEGPDVLAQSAPLNFATLAEQVEDWHRVLTDLAEAFAAGDPVADPKRYPKTCRHCGQRTLCRLNPASLLPEEDWETARV